MGGLLDGIIAMISNAPLSSKKILAFQLESVVFHGQALGQHAKIELKLDITRSLCKQKN